MTDEKLEMIFEAEKQAKIIIDEANEEKNKITSEGEKIILDLKAQSKDNRKEFKKNTLAKVNDDYNKKYEEILACTRDELSTKKDNLKEKIDELKTEITKEILDKWQ